jgi:hypothetical protein
MNILKNYKGTGSVKQLPDKCLCCGSPIFEKNLGPYSRMFCCEDCKAQYLFKN